MAGVHIVTDSACDLTETETQQLGVRVVPLTIRFGDEEFTDREELSVEDFYRRMATSASLPETAAPSPGRFEQAFRAAAGDGAEAVVCVNLSSGLSATMQAAQAGADLASDAIEVRVVDSRSITSGLGTQVRRAALAASDGASADEVVALVEDLRARTRVYGALSTLDNLKKGGRIGGAKALLGSMLSVKPVIDISTGVVEEAAKPRTRRKSMEWLRDTLFAEPSVEALVIPHGLADDLADMEALLTPRFGPDDYRTSVIGAVIGAHGGPGVIGITYLVPG